MSPDEKLHRLGVAIDSRVAALGHYSLSYTCRDGYLNTRIWEDRASACALGWPKSLLIRTSRDITNPQGPDVEWWASRRMEYIRSRLHQLR